MELIFIDTIAALKNFLDSLGESDGQPPRLYVDLEGNNLSRNGTLSLVTILLEPEKDVYLIDITTLRKDAFTTTSDDDRTMKSVFESSEIMKVFFDVRNDSDALFGLYGIRLQGIEDLQLMELASRNFNRRTVNGLAKCIERDSTIGFAERRNWQSVKDKGKSLFDPKRGGSYAVFDQRPLSDDIKKYCVQDVVFMPHLRTVYRAKLCDAWWEKIEAETKARVLLSQSPTFQGKGQHMALGPPGWISWNPKPSERLLRTMLEEAPARKRVASPSPLPSSHDLAPPRSDVAGEMTTVIRDMGRLRSGWDFDEYADSDLVLGRSSDRDSEPDYTACDKDCGYCGRCPY